MRGDIVAPMTPSSLREGNTDNAVGLNWSLTVPAGGTETVSHTTSFG